MTNDKKKEKSSILSLIASSLFHLMLFIIAYFFTDLNINKMNPNSEFVQVFTQKNDMENVNFEKAIKEEIKKEAEPKNETYKTDLEQQPKLPPVTANFIDQKADTSALEQIYSESSLNVSIKYPTGWTFIDQNVDRKLDGVTFWASSSSYSPPPYVHLEVRDKSLFNPNRFKHSLVLRDAVVYFNDPETLANYVSQTFYFRTETDEDFNLKLTIKGEESFYSFAPTFYGMLKSFKFSDSLF